jgi:polysaccharide pyruvyl transferase WcaK-like protein
MCGSANLGDTAIQEVMIAELRKRRPDVAFVGLSSKPEDVAHTLGIPGFPATGLGQVVRPGEEPRAEPLPGGGRLGSVRNIFRAADHLDMVIVSGGGQLEDFWGGPWAHPFRLLVWAASARARGRALAAFGVGVDELRSPLSNRFARTAIRLAAVRYFRDVDSAVRICGEADSFMAGDVAPDAAFGLPSVPASSAPRPSGDGEAFAVLSPPAFSAFGGVSREAYDRYLRALAATGDALARQGLRVRFVCSQTTMDPPVVEEVVGLMSEPGYVELPAVTDVEGFLAAVRGARVVVASRLHAIIFSAVAECPLVAVSPTREATRQVFDLDLTEWCLPIDGLEADRLMDVTRLAAQDHRAVRSKVSERVEELRDRLGEAFDELAAAIPKRRFARRSLASRPHPIRPP